MSMYIAITMFLLASATMYSQEVKTILMKSRQKCQSVQSGYYEMTKFMQYPTEKDTSKATFTCHFRKLADDTLFPSAFHNKLYWKDTLRSDALYTGDELVRMDIRDSTATIMSKSLWAKTIKSYSHNFTFYSPLTSRNSWPVPTDSHYIDGTRTFRFIGVETIGAASCYHIQMDVAPDNDSANDMRELRNEYHIWISQSDYIPVQFSATFDFVMDSDTMYQYELCRLDKYELDNLKDNSALSLTSLPAYVKLKDYVPHKVPEPLAVNSSAPNWELTSLKGTKVSLESMRGQLVLIDFFYKSCFPCMQALPSLQALHEKFKSRGLVVVGIDPFDKKEDIAPFLAKRGVTYTILLGGMDIAREYRVSGYPNLFLIDKQGRIIDIHGGYTKSMEGKLEALIIRSLQ